MSAGFVEFPVNVLGRVGRDVPVPDQARFGQHDGGGADGQQHLPQCTQAVPLPGGALWRAIPLRRNRPAPLCSQDAAHQLGRGAQFPDHPSLPLGARLVKVFRVVGQNALQLVGRRPPREQGPQLGQILLSCHMLRPLVRVWRDHNTFFLIRNRKKH